MGMLCPECLGPLVTSDGKTASCTLHGGQYRILYLRGQSVVPQPQRPTLKPVAGAGTANSASEAENPYRAPAGGVQNCVHHPAVQTELTCESCGQPICSVCSFPQATGGSLCPDCVGRARVPIPTAPEVPAGVNCVRHPDVQAVDYCGSCRAAVCSTCDFALPGGVHVCPDCATKSNRGLSSARKTLVGWAFALAAWCTLGLALLLLGAFAEVAADPHSAEAFGVVFSFLVFIPALVGTGLSVATLDRRLSNPPVVWVAIVWNVLVLAILLLLTVIGLFVG